MAAKPAGVIARDVSAPATTSAFVASSTTPVALVVAWSTPRIVLVSASVFLISVSYTHLRAHETVLDLVCRLLLEKKN